MAELDWETSRNEHVWDESMDRQFESLLQKVGPSAGGLSKFRIVEGVGQVSINTWTHRKIDLHVETPSGMTINVSQFYYPTWTAQLPAESSSLAVHPSQPDGLISISIPQGSHDVLLQITRSHAEKIGEIISLISVVVLLSYVYLSRHRDGKLVGRRTF